MTQVDLHHCYKCERDKPIGQMSLVAGKLRGKGVCQDCRNLFRRVAYWGKRQNTARHVKALELLNLDVLTQLIPGTYELVFNPANTAIAGYLKLSTSRAVLHHDGRDIEMDYALSVLSKSLSDRNLLITGKLLRQQVEPENVGQVG